MSKNEIPLIGITMNSLAMGPFINYVTQKGGGGGGYQPVLRCIH